MTDTAKVLKPGQRVTVRATNPAGTYTSLPLVEIKAGDRLIISVDSPTPPPPPPPPPPPDPDPTPTPTPSGTNILGIDLSTLPKSGAAYDHVKALAAKSATLDLGDNTGPGNDVLIAKGILGDKAGVLAMLRAAKNLSGSGAGTPMGPGRNLIAWPIAASLAGEHGFDAEFRRLRDFQYPFNNLVDHAKRANNHGCACHASLIALDAHLGDTTHLNAKVLGPFRARFEPNPSFKFSFSDTLLQPNPSSPVVICPPGSTVKGVNADGLLPEEQRREASFPNCGDYNYAAASQLLLGLILLRGGFGIDGFAWGSHGSERTFKAFQRLGCKPGGDDTYLGYIVRKAFGVAYLPVGGSPDGKWIACVDYLFG